MVVAIKVYENSKKILEDVENIKDILNWSSQTYKLEAGPAHTVDHMLRVIKPDIFEPLPIGKIKDKICHEDVQVWWVVTTTPVCFGWRNGNCKNVKITSKGVYNNCKFIHEHSPYIKVQMVTTETLLKKMKNKTKKLRENGTKLKKQNYINPFTGKWYPCNYKKVKVNNVRQNYIISKTKLVKELNDKFTN